MHMCARVTCNLALQCWRTSSQAAHCPTGSEQLMVGMIMLTPDVQDSAAFPQAAQDFEAKLQDPSSNGAVFFAVCR